MDAIYLLLLVICIALTALLAWVKCSSSKWLMGFMGFLSAYVGLILLDSQNFYISPALYFLLLAICFLPGPIILGYVGHISSRINVDAKDFVFCLLPVMMVLLCNDLLGGYPLWALVEASAYETNTYTALFNLMSAMAGLHLLAYLAKAFQVIVLTRKDWSSHQSQTLPDSWYDMIKVLLVILVANITQVVSAFVHPSGESFSLGDFGFISLVWYFIYLAIRTAIRNNKGQIEDEVILGASEYLSQAHKEQEVPLSDYQTCANHIQSNMVQAQLFLQEDLSLSSLAQQLDTTPHRLSEVLNHYFHKSFYEFVNDYRVQYAAEQLLREPKQSITEIYFSAGFTSKSTFYGHFKKAFNCTPTEYRKRATTEAAIDASS